MYSKNRLIETQPTVKKVPIDYNKMQVGLKTLDDAILRLSDFAKNNTLADKQTTLNAISNLDYRTMREISNYFYRISGLYSRILRYMAFMYNYDWLITPLVNDPKLKKEKILDGFYKSLTALDNFQVKKNLGDIALKILRNGCYYGYKVETDKGIVLQELPVEYCRARYNFGNKPAVEFNMKYFDDAFSNTILRLRVLSMFPKEFSKGYRLYKEGKLRDPAESSLGGGGWYLLDPKLAVKFNANGEDYPMFISAIPLLIDLDEAQGLNRKKMMQRLLKIVIQKMPLDKNGETIFELEEIRQIHNNAVKMLSRAIGVDVLTTFADVDVKSMVESKSEDSGDDLESVERQFFNSTGISQMQFNTDGNLALEKSILNDEATIYNMVLQFEQFLNELLDPYNTNPKKINYRVQILKTTIYNYKEMAKIFKEQMQVGFSKMLPQIAMGQSQSSILANAHFENEILNLVEIFIPPLMSSTMNQQVLGNVKNTGQNNQNGTPQKLENNKEAGRPEKEDSEKSEKTIRNLESQN